MSDAEPLGGFSGTRFRACPLCEAICGLRLEFEQGRLVSARGDPDDPFSAGHICPKGTAMEDLEADPERLRRPLRRVGDRWEEIDWDQALQWAGQRLAQVQAEHGNNAVGAYLGNPTVHHFGHFAYAPALLRLLKTQNVYSASSVDQWPHQLVAAQMYGHQFIIPIPDIDRTGFLLMLGANPVASNGSLMTAPGVRERLKKLAKRGTLVVVDPRRTETAALASEHIAIRPGADAGLLIQLLAELTRCGPPRPSALRERLDGWDAAIEAVLAMAAKPLDCGGVEAEKIAALAAGLYAAPSSAVYGRMGLSTQRHGSLCQWLIQLINLYTGQLDRPGAAEKRFQPTPAPRQLLDMLLHSGSSGLTVDQLLAQPHGVDLGPLEPCLAELIQHPEGRIRCAPPLLLEALAGYCEAGAVAQRGALSLIGRREVRDNNSWMHNLPRLRKGAPRHDLWMHGDDLRQRDLDDGDWVRIRSAVGSVRTRVRRRDELLPGVVCLPHGYGHRREGTEQSLATVEPGVSYNDLSDGGVLDAPSGNAALNGLQVWVEASEG